MMESTALVYGNSKLSNTKPSRINRFVALTEHHRQHKIAAGCHPGPHSSKSYSILEEQTRKGHLSSLLTPMEKRKREGLRCMCPVLPE